MKPRSENIIKQDMKTTFNMNIYLEPKAEPLGVTTFYFCSSSAPIFGLLAVVKFCGINDSTNISFSFFYKGNL